MNQFDLEYQDGVESQYYEGVLMDRWTTPNDNIMIRVKDVKRMISVEGTILKTKGELNELNFLVPKRRTMAIGDCKRVDMGTKIQVKLLKESRSKKFVVAKILQIKR